MTTLDSVTFDTSGMKYEGDYGDVRIWRTEAGDGVGIVLLSHHRPIFRSISAGSTAYADSTRSPQQQVEQRPSKSIFFNPDACYSIWTIVKIPAGTRWDTYIGSITLPFRDFSYVLKTQCEEHGVTGVTGGGRVWIECYALGEIQWRGRNWSEKTKRSKFASE